MLPIFQASFEPALTGQGQFNQIFATGGETVDTDRLGVVGRGMTISVNGSATQVGVTKSLDVGVRIIDCWVKIINSAIPTVNSDICILHTWKNANFTSDFFQVRLKYLSTGKFHFALVTDPSNVSTSYNEGTTDFDPRDININEDNWYRYTVVYSQSTNQLELYIDNKNTPELSVTVAYGAAFVNSFHIGKFQTTGWNNCKLIFDNLKCIQDLALTPTNNLDKMRDVYYGFLQKYMSPEGCVFRYAYDPETSAYNPNGSGPKNRKIDWVSEGQAYAQLLAVLYDNKTEFDKMETWATNNVERRLSGESVGPNLMSWFYEPQNNVIIDKNWATDADLDRINALFWADARWGSNGTINYRQKAIAIAHQVVDSSTTFLNNKLYIVGGDPSKGKQYNVSYFQNYVFYFLKTLDTSYSLKYQQAIDGSNDMLTKVSDSSGGLATTSGLFPNWNGLNESTGDVTEPPIWGDTKYTYDAFRTVVRLYMSYLFYQDIASQSLLNGNLYNFFSSQWNNGIGTIKAEYNHDGTIAGNYENSMMYAINAYAFKAKGDNTNFNLIYSTKVENTYKQNPNGSLYNFYTGQAQSSYFGSFWVLWGMLIKEGVIVNYLPAPTPAPTPSVEYYMMAVYPELEDGKIALNYR